MREFLERCQRLSGTDEIGVSITMEYFDGIMPGHKSSERQTESFREEVWTEP